MKIAVALLTLLPVILAVSNLCDKGWTSFQENCLYFSNTAKTWMDAEIFCRTQLGWLMTDDSEAKHNFVRDILYVLRNFKETKFFIGGSDIAFERQWRWLETGLNVRTGANSFSAWGIGEPDGNNSKNCMAFKWQNSSLVWSDESCGHVTTSSHHHSHAHGALYFICEKPNNAPAAGSVIG